MINLAVQLLAGQLNQYLRRTYNLGEDVVVVSNLLEMDGSVAANVNNKLVVFLVNIEKDAVPFRQVSSHDVGRREMQGSAPYSIQDLSNLWGALGGKYLPSIMYRVRMVAFDAEDITGRIPLVSEPKPTVR